MGSQQGYVSQNPAGMVDLLGEYYDYVNGQYDYRNLPDYGKDCIYNNQCSDGLVCMKPQHQKFLDYFAVQVAISFGRVCCAPFEKNVFGKCVDDRLKTGSKGCKKSEQCQSGYCSMPPTGFWADLAEAFVEFLGFKVGEGVCCDPGTDWDAGADACIEFGVFVKQGQSDYCKLKKEKGAACKDREGKCNNAGECMLGSYCTKEDVCCPKGHKWDGRECVPNPGRFCGECGKGVFNGCDESECLSLGKECYFDDVKNKCYVPHALEHGMSDCQGDDSKCYAEGEELHCAESDNSDVGVCCWPWERQNTFSGKCEPDCDGNFCDDDKDGFDTRLEMKYWSNPERPSDKPYLRLTDPECTSPFKYPDNALGSLYQAAIGVINVMLFSILEPLRIAMSIFLGRFDNTIVRYYGWIVGAISGLGYGLADDANFLLGLPKMLSDLVEMVHQKIGDAMSGNDSDALEEGVGGEVEKPGFWAGIMQTIADRSEKLKLDSFDECSSVIYTKSYTITYAVAFVAEQVFLLGKVGKWMKLSKIGIVRKAGGAFVFADEAFGKVGKAVADVMGITKVAKFSVKQMSNAVEVASEWMTKAKLWKSLSPDMFETAMKRYADLKQHFVKRGLKESEAAASLKGFLNSNAGQRILIEAYSTTGKSGWNRRAIEMLIEQMNKHGSKNIDEAFSRLSRAEFRKFGKEFSQHLPKGGDRLSYSMFSDENLDFMLKDFTKNKNVQKWVAAFSESSGQKQIVKMFPAKGIDGLIVASGKAGDVVDDTIILTKGNKHLGWSHIKMRGHNADIQKYFGLPNKDEAVKDFIGTAIQKGKRTGIGVKQTKKGFYIIYEIPGKEHRLAVKISAEANNAGNIITAYPAPQKYIDNAFKDEGILATFDNSVAKTVGGECFIGGTLVAASTGRAAIEELSVGDYVLAYDGDEYGYMPIERTFEHETNELLVIELENGEVITTTPEHPFFVRGED